MSQTQFFKPLPRRPWLAGADPGPACYGKGGPLAVTDVNLLLGRLLPERFPFPLDQEAAQRQLQVSQTLLKQQTVTPE